MRRLLIIVALALGLGGAGVTSVAVAGETWNGAFVSASDLGASWPLRAATAQIACAQQGFTPPENAVSVVVSHRRYALDKQAVWLRAHPIAPLLRDGESKTSSGVLALRLLARRLCTRQRINLACDTVTVPPQPQPPCDPLAAYPQALTVLCHATCPYLDHTPGDHLVPARGRIVLRVTVDPPDVAVRGVIYGCADDLGIVPFVARSGDTIDAVSAGKDCFVSATALWTVPFSEGARHVVTLALVPA